MAFFVAHFEAMITYLGRPGVPRTNNHAERANRRYRAVAAPRYGWAAHAGLRAFLIALQGFDSGRLYSLRDSLARPQRRSRGTRFALRET